MNQVFSGDAPAAYPLRNGSEHSAQQRRKILAQTWNRRMAPSVVGSLKLSRQMVPYADPLFPFPIASSIIESSRSLVAGFGGVGRRLRAKAALSR